MKSSPDGEGVWERLAELEEQHRTGALAEADFAAALGRLWVETTAGGGAGTVLREVLTQTAAEVRGGIGRDGYHRRLQWVWARWLLGDGADSQGSGR